MTGTHKFTGSYYGESWRLLTRDKGWFKPMLALTAAGFIPLFGQVALLGYGLEWARLTAWGIDAAPKQRGVSIGGILRSGFRGLGVTLGLTILVSFVLALVGQLFRSSDFLNNLWSFLTMVVNAYLVIISLMAALRAAIYQRIGAGFQFDRLWDMLHADFGGITWIMLGNIAWSFVLAIVMGIAASFFTFAATPSMMALARWIVTLADGGAVTGAQLAEALRQMVTAYAPFFAVETIIMSLFGTVLTLIVLNALGLWLRQFNVPNWGLSEDPLPPSLDPAPPVYTGPAVPMQQDLPPEQGFSTPQYGDDPYWQQPANQPDPGFYQQTPPPAQPDAPSEPDTPSSDEPPALPPVQGGASASESAWDEPAPEVPAAPPATPTPSNPPAAANPNERVTTLIPLPGEEPTGKPTEEPPAQE